MSVQLALGRSAAGRGRLALVSRGSPITVCRIPVRRTRTSPLLPSNRLYDFRDRPGYTSLRGHG
ncbi:hypothetical protein [Actinomyces lilanjuaniae]|uniref:hypothetical protein n=1 Tax=Actinomyces lilanjuaniae TaxID=2321394 RepID=UPI0013C40CF8|nr:hypothetical protein [Actinomyces lilanjuaniae]